ncbi:hypothetical protein CH373_13320 [Leptospira perolatii]|uniref:Uncharacterized protein n=1 Tax=Leptospira perolatii TaxID=2023191 RepID=A0A2M9ZL19_9LEPT|nr:hypothetical protein [Leptospira perolatii]PJZ69911.1 hypothetical protein CH360_08365 [Leptospira perolatii]PJZ72681.1 hypothetical protein CH373_13320 [Leptospira perolatii]
MLKEKEEKSETYSWKKLIKDQKDFFRIVGILNRYYDYLRGSLEESNSQKFRKRLLETRVEDTEIYFKRFGVYEYVVFAKIRTEQGSETDSWIHLDGILQERTNFLERWIQDHPIFGIKCISDIYEESCSMISKEEVENLEACVE